MTSKVRNLFFILAMFGIILIASNCGGSGMASGNFSASVKVEASIEIPIAKMPTKYASWAVEVRGFLEQVNWAAEATGELKSNLALAFGLDAKATADQIAAKIRDSIKKTVTVKVTVEPPSVEVTAKCEAEASAEASGSAGGGKASGEAEAGIKANCEAKVEAHSGGIKVERDVKIEVDPIVKDNWDKIQVAIVNFNKIPRVIAKLDGRSDELNSRGINLAGSVVTDIAADPTLVPQTQKNCERVKERGK